MRTKIEERSDRMVALTESFLSPHSGVAQFSLKVSNQNWLLRLVSMSPCMSNIKTIETRKDSDKPG